MVIALTGLITKRVSFFFMALLCLVHVADAKSLSIEQFRDSNPEIPIVYEFPDDEDRQKAVDYVRQIRDAAFPKSELIDAGSVSAEVLKQKLTGQYFLYTVPGPVSRLYNALIKPSLSFTPSSIKIDGVSYGGNDIRLYFLASNQPSGGQVLVCAMNRNAALLAGKVRTGDASYYVFLGSETAREGFYDKDFKYGAEGLSEEDAEEDINQFFSDAEQVHPDLLYKIKERDYLELKSRIKSEIIAKTKAAKGGRISVRDLAYTLYFAAAAFGDGHTSIHYSALPRRDWVVARYPPFLLDYRNGEFIVSDARDKGLVGKHLVSMAGKRPEEFLKPVFDRCSGELFHFKAAKFTREQPFWWAFTGLLDGSPRLTVEFSDKNGRPEKLSLATIDYEAFSSLAIPQKKEETSLKFLAGGVAYFRYPSFKYTEAERTRVDGIFREVKARGAKRLIIDIRGNSGGHSGMADYIAKYLTEKPVRGISMLQLKMSPQYIEKWGSEMGEDAKALKGVLVTRRIQEEKQEKPEAFYEGKAILLTDNYTFSSASGFAVMFRDFGMGRIAGYETGGLPSCFGEMLQLTLRNSGIMFGVSDKKFLSPMQKPGDDEHGVLPDLPATVEVLAKYRVEDPLLSYAVDSFGKGE
ncbi:MAG: S41 family peptidase [Elusimicrobiales bacterium]